MCEHSCVRRVRCQWPCGGGDGDAAERGGEGPMGRWPLLVLLSIAACLEPWTLDNHGSSRLLSTSDREKYYLKPALYSYCGVHIAMSATFYAWIRACGERFTPYYKMFYLAQFYLYNRTTHSSQDGRSVVQQLICLAAYFKVPSLSRNLECEQNLFCPFADRVYSAQRK